MPIFLSVKTVLDPGSWFILSAASAFRTFQVHRVPDEVSFPSGLQEARMMPVNHEDLVKIGVPLLLGVIASVFSYRLGRRARIDEQRREQGLELGKEIAALYQEVTDLEDRLHDFYISNYRHLKDVDKAVDNFEKMKNLYELQHRAVQGFSDKKLQLEEKIGEGRYYFKGSIMKNLQIYLDNLKFNYDPDVFGSMIPFYRQLFLNLTDPRSRRKRKKIRKKIFGNLRKLKP